MFKNIYFYRARLLPTLITSIPLLIFINKIIAVKYSAALKNIFDVLPLIIHLGLSAAIIYLLIQVNRFLAKEIFQRIYFKEELYMPTTNHLLIKSSYYHPTIQDSIREKILSKYNIQLANAQDEQADEKSARKLIVSAVSQIRISLQGNAMLLQHNIEYGFCRNLVGGSLLSFVISIIIFFYGKQNNQSDLKTVGIICSILYLLPILFSKLLISYFGKYYSKILYDQFLSLH